VNFAAQTVTLTTSATTTLAWDAPSGTAPASDPRLNLSAVLTFPAANTFTGPLGANGNATGRFYGTPLAAATATKPMGAPPEIGGTFVVILPGVGSLHGSYGAN